MSIILKQSPTALLDWLQSTYPLIPPSIVHFAHSGIIDQTRLNPYTSRIIVVYRWNAESGRIHIYGCIFYGSEDICPLIALSTYIGPIDAPLTIDAPIVPADDICMDRIKDHIGGTYFSLETLKILLTVGSYVRGFIGPFLKREMQRDILSYLARFSGELTVLEEPEVEDYRHFWQCSPQKRLNPCPIWFEVPLWEWGKEVSASQKPLFPRGLYHINATLMNPWIWRKLTLNCSIKHPGIDHPEQALHIIGCIKDHINLKKRRKHISLEEMGNIDKKLAPCMKWILGDSGKFPKDLERQQAVRVLAKAGVPINYVEKRLTELNDKDPHNSGRMPLLARWDYKSHYAAGYSAPNCELVLCCPIDPGQPLDVRKSKCYLLYTKTFPEKKIPHGKSFYGPLQWLDW